MFKNNQLHVTVKYVETAFDSDSDEEIETEIHKEIDIDTFVVSLRRKLDQNDFGIFRDNELTRQRIVEAIALNKRAYYKLLIPQYLAKLWPDNPFSVEITQSWFEFLAANKNATIPFDEMIKLFKCLYESNNKNNQYDFKMIMGILPNIDVNMHNSKYLLDMIKIYQFLCQKEHLSNYLDMLEAEVKKYADTLEQGNNSRKILSGYFCVFRSE